MRLVPNYSLVKPGRIWLSLALILSISFAIGACRTASVVEPDQNTGPTVHTIIAGVAVDEAGMPLSGVAVSAHGQTTTSDEYGYFVLPDVTVPKDRAVVLGKHDGYFTAARASSVTENGVTEVKLNLLAHGSLKTVNAANGGTVSVTGASGTATVKFQPGSMTVNGAPYSGSAQVAVRYLDPTESSFANFFPGDPAAVRESGDNTTLVSYGVLQVEMRTPSGETIQPAAGKPAELTYPIPSTLANPPQSIPLWYFDEARGLWVEEGMVTKQGNNYVGTVKHFTPWNVDIPGTRATVSGRVVCNGRGINGVLIRIGQSETITGRGGSFSMIVPANTILEVKVDLESNDGLYGSEPITLAEIPENEEKIVTVPLSTGCPATIRGTLTNDEGTKIPGTVTWLRPNGKVRTVTTADGTFEMMVPPGTHLDLSASSWACAVKKIHSAESGASESDKDLGPIVVCSNKPIVGDVDISTFGTLNTYATLSPDGQFIAISGRAPAIIVRNAKTGQLVSSTPFSSDSGWVSTPQFSQDGSKYLVGGYTSRESKVIVVETSTGNILREIPGIDSACFFPDGKSLLAQRFESNGFILFKFSIESGVAEVIYNMSDIPQYAMLMGMSADGKKAVLYFDYTFIFYDLVTGKKDRQITINEASDFSLIKFSSDLSKVAFTSYKTNEIKVADLVSGQIISKPGLKLNDSYYHKFDLHSNGKDVLFQGMSGGELLSPALVNATTGAITKSLSMPAKSAIFGHMSISRDGKRASGIYQHGHKIMLRVWEL